LTTLRLIELLNAVRRCEALADLHRPCTLLLGMGEWAKRAEAVGMKPEGAVDDSPSPLTVPVQVPQIVTNGGLQPQASAFIASRASMLPSVSPGDSAESPMKQTNENANGFALRETGPASH
jgi:hypothetical protein